MTKQQLQEKYGDALVGVIPASHCGGMQPWTPASPETEALEGIELDYIPRYDAELDISYRQPIPYILMRDLSGRFFTTRRLSGDHRLTGKLSLGIGGHVNANERLREAMNREIDEEVILPNYGTVTPYLLTLGCIASNQTDVDRVHLGFVSRLICDDTLRVRETDVLHGCWHTPDELRRRYDELEPWAQLLLDKGVLDAPLHCNEIAVGLYLQYRRKNRDYGDSFHRTHKRFGATSGFVRINDKVERIITLHGDEATVTGESMLDTLGDAATYALMQGAELSVNRPGEINDTAVDDVASLFRLLSVGSFDEVLAYDAPEEIKDELMAIHTASAAEDYSAIPMEQNPLHLLFRFAARLIKTYQLAAFS